MELGSEKKLLSYLNRIAIALEAQNKHNEKVLLLEMKRFKRSIKTVNEDDNGEKKKV